MTLRERGDESTGWALAHRLNAWARTGDGNHAYKLVAELLGRRTNPNLWDVHPPFQIDGNLGATAGIAEMLLQSHEGYIHVLPSLPDVWDSGSVSGLTARGAFEVTIEWENGTAKRVLIKSNQGNEVRVKADFSDDVTVKQQEKEIDYVFENGLLVFESRRGEAYEITGFIKQTADSLVTDLEVTDALEISWNGGACDILRAVDDSPVYECIAKNVSSPYKDSYDFSKADTITYKAAINGFGITKTINHSTKLERDIYENIIKSKREH